MLFRYAVDNGDSSFTQLVTAYSLSSGDHLAVHQDGVLLAYYSVTSEDDGLITVSVVGLPLSYHPAIVVI